jgi:hypothetical protein
VQQQQQAMTARNNKHICCELYEAIIIEYTAASEVLI